MLNIDDLTKGELIGFAVAMNNDRENAIDLFTCTRKYISWDEIYENNMNHIERIRKLHKEYLE
jgi:hypothetical protein